MSRAQIVALEPCPRCGAAPGHVGECWDVADQWLDHDEGVRVIQHRNGTFTYEPIEGEMS